jgi:hypothetical protein
MEVKTENGHGDVTGVLTANIWSDGQIDEAGDDFISIFSSLQNKESGQKSH